MSLAHTISAWNRRRKWRLFLASRAPSATATILDVGFNEEEYSPTDNFLEKNYPHPEHITALGIDAPEKFHKRYPAVKAVQYDGNIFPFPDQSFDICWSNAVIEHVGSSQQQLQFIREMKRVARHVFFTTPNRHFPIEVHTRTPLLHWLPQRIFFAYLRLIGKTWATGNYMRLFSAHDLRHLLSAAGVTEYKLFRNRFCGFTMDFVVMW